MKVNTSTSVRRTHTVFLAAFRARFLVLFVAVFCCLFLLQMAHAPSVQAAINPQINFQGKLTNPDGTNITDGSYSIIFSLYSVSSGGTAIWTETQSTVSVAAGIFQVSLGSVTSLPGSVDFNSTPLYLGIKVGADAEMTPRIQFTAAPYAFNSDKLGGITSAGFLQLSPSSQQAGFININGNIAAGTFGGNSLTNSSLLFGATASASVQAASGQALQLDSGASGTVAVGATNATSVTVGKVGTVTNAPGGLNIDSGTTTPTTDQVSIDNTLSAGVTTGLVNGLNVKYRGGAAAVEAAGMRVDFIPGGVSGGTWSGMRIVETSPTAPGVTAYGLKLEGVAGPGNEEGVYVGTGWDIGMDIQSGGMQLAAQAEPAVPAAGNLRIYAKDIAGRVMPKWVGPAGVDTPFQASLGFNRVSFTVPNGAAGTCSTTGFTVVGSTFTGAGTCTAPALTSTNLLTSVRRTVFPTTATAGNVVYHKQNATMAWRG